MLQTVKWGGIKMHEVLALNKQTGTWGWGCPLSADGLILASPKLAVPLLPQSSLLQPNPLSCKTAGSGKRFIKGK